MIWYEKTRHNMITNVEQVNKIYGFNYIISKRLEKSYKLIPIFYQTGYTMRKYNPIRQSSNNARLPSRNTGFYKILRLNN